MDAGSGNNPFLFTGHDDDDDDVIAFDGSGESVAVES